MSKSLSPLDPAVVDALMTMVRAKAPPNRPMTVAEVEAAVFELLQYLGSTLTNEAVAEQIAAAEKRGTGRPAADGKCDGSGGGRARS